MTLSDDSKQLVKQSVDLAYPGETVASLMKRSLPDWTSDCSTWLKVDGKSFKIDTEALDDVIDNHGGHFLCMERTQDGGVHRILEYTVSRREVPK